MSYPTLTLAFPAPGVALVTLNRPDAANALNAQMAQDLIACFGAMDTTCRVMVLTGSGTRAFCAGADLKERKGMDMAQWEAQHRQFRAARDAILNAPFPVMAAVNGAAFGGGLELALACDCIYAAETASFALPEATLGIMPGLGGTQALPRAIGPGRALEMMMTGHAIGAEQAMTWGMVNRVCRLTVLTDETVETARAIASAAPLSVRAIRKVVKAGAALPLEKAVEAEREAYMSVIQSQDRAEGINAFNEKRKPVFTGS